MQILQRVTEAILRIRNYSDASEINCGDCWIWAVAAHACLPGSKIYEAVNRYRVGHAFVEYEGKYYDSESPEGVDNWKNLRYYVLDQQRNRGRIKNFYYPIEVKEQNHFFAQGWSEDFVKDSTDISNITQEVGIAV